VVCDLERRVLLWVGDDRTEEAVELFFTKQMGARRCHTLRVVCMDMWASYAKLVREHATNAQILLDRFHIVKHLIEAVEEVPRSEMRRLSLKEKVIFKRSRWLLLKNSWNLTATSRNAFRHWSAGTRRSCAPTTSKKPFNCSESTSSPSGRKIIWTNGCAQP
jgi:transposase